MFIIYIFRRVSYIYIYLYMMGVVGVTGYTNHSRFPRSVFSTFAEFTASQSHRRVGCRGILMRKCHWVVHGDTANLVHDLKSWNDDMEIMESKNHLKMRIQWARSLKIVHNFDWPWCGENFWRWVNHWVDLTLFPLHHPPKGFLLSFFIILTEMDQRSIDVSQPRYYELISGQIMILNKS